MYTVTFAFDLGDYVAIYTGRIVGTYENGYKVTYFEPTVRELLSIDLPESEVIGKGFTPVRMLPLAPFIQETSEPRVIEVDRFSDRTRLFVGVTSCTARALKVSHHNVTAY